MFELGGKTVALTSTGGVNGHSHFWVGRMAANDSRLVPDYAGRLDYGANGISSLYAAKTATSARPPFERRVLFGFGG